MRANREGDGVDAGSTLSDASHRALVIDVTHALAPAEIHSHHCTFRCASFKIYA
jgi:hypothetical protein